MLLFRAQTVRFVPPCTFDDSVGHKSRRGYPVQPGTLPRGLARCELDVADDGLLWMSSASSCSGCAECARCRWIGCNYGCVDAAQWMQSPCQPSSMSRSQHVCEASQQALCPCYLLDCRHAYHALFLRLHEGCPHMILSMACSGFQACHGDSKACHVWQINH